MPPTAKPPLRAFVIVPAPAGPPAPFPPLLRVGGLSVLVRSLLALNQAGVENLIVVSESEGELLMEEVRRDPRLEKVRFSAPSEAFAPDSLRGGDFLLVTANRVFSSGVPEDLLREDPSQDGCVWYRDGDGGFAGVAYCSGAFAEVLSAAADEPGDLSGRLDRILPSSAGRPLPGGFIERVRSEAEAHRAEGRLLKSLVKETDSFVSRHIDRPVSLTISRRLARTRITPNQMTLVHSCIGLAGAVLFAQPVRWVQVLGALLFLFSSTIDGCDGEIARLKFQQSEFGGWLDIWSDNVVHVAVFAAIAAGLYRGSPADRFIWLGVFSCLGVLLSVGIVSWKILRFKSGEGNFFVSVGEGLKEEPQTGEGSKKPRKDWLRDIDDFLARRDFIYLLVPLAAFGKLEWFLWASAIGGNLFFLSLLILYARAKAPRSI